MSDQLRACHCGLHLRTQGETHCRMGVKPKRSTMDYDPNETESGGLNDVAVVVFFVGVVALIALALFGVWRLP